MNRRKFFNTTVALSAASLVPAYSFGNIAPGIGNMTIAEIEFWNLSGEREPNEGFLGWIQSK
jgi:hypothetical protein